MTNSKIFKENILTILYFASFPDKYRKYLGQYKTKTIKRQDLNAYVHVQDLFLKNTNKIINSSIPITNTNSDIGF